MNRLFRSSALRRLALSARRYEGQEFFFEIPQKEIAYKRNYKVGEEGQFSYNNVRTFPPEYEPWRSNYDGTGMLMVWVVAFVYAWYMYEQNYLEMSGRTQRDSARKYYAV